MKLDARNAAATLLPADLNTDHVINLIRMSIQEDLTPGNDFPEELVQQDVTSFSTLPDGLQLQGEIFCRDSGVVAGLPLTAAVFKFVDPQLDIKIHKVDGDAVRNGDLLMSAAGSGRSLLLAERTALNFLGRLSGIASLTARYVAEISGTGALMLDTRKTVPGFRALDKYAVRQGGGQNHRMGLYDMALIKDNHVDAAGGVEAAVMRVHNEYGESLPVEVEVRTIAELEIALKLPVDRILLDNMSLDEMRAAVRITAGSVKLEASGNVTLDSVRSIAETGVDFISSGALTHSVKVFDVSLRLKIAASN